jgi:hypothetical protein
MRTPLGLQNFLLLLMTVGSAALTFVVRKPRLLWSLLLAAVCGFCAGRLSGRWDDPFVAGDENLLLLLLPPIVVGAGFAWKSLGWKPMTAGWLGIPYGTAALAGDLSACWSSGCGEPLVVLSLLIDMLAGIILAAVGAALALILQALIRRLRL